MWKQTIYWMLIIKDWLIVWKDSEYKNASSQVSQFEEILSACCA